MIVDDQCMRCRDIYVCMNVSTPVPYVHACTYILCSYHVLTVYILCTFYVKRYTKLQGRRTSASLMVANLTDPEREGPGKGGFRGLYSLFWQLRGDMCGVRTDFRYCTSPVKLCSNHTKDILHSFFQTPAEF